MRQANMAASVRQPAARAAVIDIKGEVTAQAEEALSDAYTKASETGARSIILNFRELEYMNSSGIGLLVTLLIRANRSHQKLLAIGLSEHYREIFEVTRLDEAIKICATEASALAIAGSA